MTIATKRTHKVAQRQAAPAAAQVSPAARIFMDLVHGYSYVGKGNDRWLPLHNLTFWAGAGFSKSWDNRAPVGKELFAISDQQLENTVNSGALSRLFGFEPLEDLDMDKLRQLVYFLDMNEKYPDVRPRYVDEQNIAMLRASLRLAVFRRYQTISEINYLDEKTGKFSLTTCKPNQNTIIDFFRFLKRQADGSSGLAEGLRSHFVTTNYDFVIETILDSVYGLDDSFFLYTYRGFTPRTISGRPNVEPVHDHYLVQTFIKLNGGFEIIRSKDGYELQYHRRTEEDLLSNPPVMMLPSREQDYSDPYFRTIFPKAVRLMRDSRVLVLVGYSLPLDDALIRFILRQFAEEPEDAFDKHIFYIDPMDDTCKMKLISDVWPSERADRRLSVHLFQGGFSDFAAECLKLEAS
jgi:hypothetical protein